MKLPAELWNRTSHALEHGDFTLLDELLTAENASILDLLEANDPSSVEMNEAFAWACFNGRTSDAEELIDLGADPAKSDRTGMPGFHSAASRGHVDTVRMLVRRNVPLEQLNIYGGTVLGQTLWSAVNEPRSGQADAIEILIEAGAAIEAGTSDWWNEQQIASAETKIRVAKALAEADIS
jgi:ankyrin repeat protein